MASLSKENYLIFYTPKRSCDELKTYRYILFPERYAAKLKKQ
ncbi:hypothetical protein NSMM_500037 [Nitrosomonas mobilis]|uniref:Uncharacterized protein n=1 Tax=Nitrosomonas mobilis TaxID=51642 RepID=A0A1G5SGV6_9PROT|nr:hypothetical protein NSMM_500037 [Nitrosomonas mobilis]